MTESHKKISNKLYLGFSFIYFMIVVIIFTGAYAFLSNELFAEDIHLNGHLKYVIAFSIIPILFLLSKLGGSIGISISNDKIIFSNKIYFLPVRIMKYDLKEYANASNLKIKSKEMKVFFGSKPGTSTKVFYIKGNKVIKLSPNSDSKNKPLLFSTENPDSWLEALKEKNIEIVDAPA
ncbi:MAG: hypothetical protein COC01_04125 [Bacteroidetes bacterium]|nr:MAG: hypothetical protein COC01_04125 [Bacteroidota bacterium]